MVFERSLWPCVDCSNKNYTKEERAGNRVSLRDAEFTMKRLLAAKMVFATVWCDPL